LEQVDSPASASEPAPPSASISGEPLDLASLVAPGATGGPVDLAPLVGPEAAATEATFGGGLVNINTADYDSLVALPGIGPALARRIIAHREASGPFTAVDQLIDIPGIGSRNIDDFRHLVTV
jgi:competence protein ComEA